MSDYNISVAPKTITDIWGLISDAVVELRVFSRASWVSASGGLFIIGSPTGVGGSSNNYHVIACTHDSTAHTITIGSGTLTSTLDALINSGVQLELCLFATQNASLFAMTPLAPFSMCNVIRVPASPTSTTWEDLASFNAGVIPPFAGYDVAITGDLSVSGDVTAAHFIGDGSELTGLPATGVTSFNTRTGAVTFLATDLNGVNGAGLTGIGTGTGGVLNTGSTTIGADTDADGVGVVALQTQGINRAVYNPDGSIQQIADIFDLQRRTRNPSVAPTATLLADGTGAGTAGAHLFKYSYQTAGGETMLSPASASLTFNGTHTKATISLPHDGTQYENNLDITGWNVYATKAGGSIYFKIAFVATNEVGGPGVTAGSYTFNMADGSFGATVAPTSNSAVNSNFYLDQFGSIGIGTTNLSTTDDGQGRNLTIESQTSYSYINIGTNTPDVNARVGALTFYNRGNGGNDHRAGMIVAFNDGALGAGRLEFYTGQNVVGPLRWGVVDHLGQWSLGGSLPSTASRLYLENMTTSPDGSHYFITGADTGALRFVINDKGAIGIGTATLGGRYLRFESNFALDNAGKIEQYGGVGGVTSGFVKGSILVANTTTQRFEILAPGSNGQVLTADSTVSGIGLKWA